MPSLTDARTGSNALRGSQSPRILAVPEARSTSGDEAIKLAAIAGLYLDPWQQLVLRHSLGERPDGQWAAKEVGLIVGRQNGKNAILEARELAELYLVAPLTGPRLIIHSAHRSKTALEHFRRIKGRIMDTPELLSRVKGPIRRGQPAGLRDSHGEESIELKDGSRLLFSARTSTGGQGAGFTCDLLVFDEAWNLPESVIGMVVPTLAARSFETPGVQTWYTSQAVNQQSMPYGVHLARIRERGIAGSDTRLFYAEWSVDEEEFRRNPAIADDPEFWTLANPGLGVRISVEHVMWERGGGLPWHEFLAHRFGIGDWPDTEPESDRVISAEQWKRCECTDPVQRIIGVKTFGIDVNPSRTWGSISVAGRRADELLHLATVEHQEGTGWIIEQLPDGTYAGRAVELNEEHDGCRWVMDERGPAATLIPLMKDAGLDVTETTTRDYANACGGFYDKVDQARLKYPAPQPELEQAIAAARIAPLGEAWKWAPRRSTSSDITPLISGTLAVWGADTLDEEDPEPLVAFGGRRRS